MTFSDLQTLDKPKPVVKDKPISEPGHQIPIGNYQIIGQWCDVCEDVEMHVFNKKLKKIRCLTCKTTKQLK